MLICVKITGLAYGGAGVGTITEAEDSALCGKKAFVLYAAPGETVQAELKKDEVRFVTASLVKMLNPSAARRKAPCPYFTLCGGCDLQHMEISSQRQAKLDLVKSTLERQAGVTAKAGIKLCRADLPEFNYRQRLNLHLSPAGDLGLCRPESHEVVAVDSCLLACAELNQALAALKPHGKNAAGSIRGINLELKGSDVYALPLKHEEASTAGFAAAVALLAKEIPQLKFRPHQESRADSAVGHFSQVNAAANEVLVGAVLDLITGPEVTDLYAGAGNFSLPLAKAGKQVDAVEVDPALVEHGKACAHKLELESRLEFYCASCEKYLSKHKPKETVLLDPPRSGAKYILKYFTPAKVRQIVYVSCSLPTLARDLKTLCAGGYCLEQVSVLDMFPQTHHVETISTLYAPNCRTSTELSTRSPG
jgi:23S rRNA (uracil1939-C5)-methyltransferase